MWVGISRMKAALEYCVMIGKETLKVQTLPLLDVPKVEYDEYVEALESHVRDLLITLKTYVNFFIAYLIATYRCTIGNIISVIFDTLSIYYVRYLIIKSQQENYYFWPVGFGLNGSLEECSADRHYMNALFIFPDIYFIFTIFFFLYK